MNAAHQGGLTARVMRGAAIIVAGRFFLRIIGLVNTILLARLLTPEDFGLIAIGVVIIQILENMSDLSISRAVVKFRDASSEVFDTLFTISLIRGVIVMGIMFALALPAAAFYEDVRITNIFLALGLVSMVKSFRNPRFFEFERDLDFSREFIVSILTKIASVAVSIIVALIFRTYWAIILGIAAGTTMEVILSFVFRAYRPRLSFKAFNQLIGFMGWLSASSVVIALNNKIGPLVLGRIVGAGPTGSYYIGVQLSNLVGREFAAPIVRALYPGLSSLQGQHLRMRNAFLRGVEAMAAIVAPAAFGLSFISKDATTLVLGEGWDMAAMVLAVLSPIYGLTGMLSGGQSLAMAAGKVRPVFFRELYILIIQLPVLIYTATHYGLEGALWGSVCTGIIYIGLQSRLYAMTVDDHWWRPFWIARRGLGALIPMSIWFWGIRPEVMAIEKLPLIARLLTDCATGALLYGSTLLALWLLEGRPDGFERQVLGIVKKRRLA